MKLVVEKVKSTAQKGSLKEKKDLNRIVYILTGL